ncbi:antitoxin VapB family protein [Halobaculum sp. EA56]|uniref:antitoxin VapB family protein n=1 Tax=Halobaculum sp. EA56 TaxID=3421648 RepID=UPI003EC04854
MGTKSLTITDEAYERLKADKREGESFTDTILRLTGENRDPMKGFGAMQDVDGFREAVEDTSDALDADLRSRGER